MRRFVAQIDYSNHRKVARKDTLDLRFRFPTFSFGWHQFSHIDRFDSPVDVRYRLLYLFGQQNHNMHHRTSADSIRPSMCDICFCSLLLHTTHVLYLFAPKVRLCGSPQCSNRDALLAEEAVEGLEASKKLRDFTPTCKLPLRV